MPDAALPERVETELRRLQRMAAVLILIGAATVLIFGAFSLWEAHQVRSHASELEQLTDNLCTTLRRAGIIITGSQENPCEPS